MPQQVRLPASWYVKNDEVEPIRDWVLEKSMEAGVGQALHTRVCARCSADTYKGNLTCHACQTSAPTCCVTGYPVEDPHSCTADAGHVASRAAWNMYVERFRACPVCDVPQSAHY